MSDKPLSPGYLLADLAAKLRQREVARRTQDRLTEEIDALVERLGPAIGPRERIVRVGDRLFGELLRFTPDGMNGHVVAVVPSVTEYDLAWPEPAPPVIVPERPAGGSLLPGPPPARAVFLPAHAVHINGRPEPLSLARDDERSC